LLLLFEDDKLPITLGAGVAADSFKLSLADVSAAGGKSFLFCRGSWVGFLSLSITNYYN
jgi:hypothetical protein